MHNRVVGTSVPRKEGVGKVTGRAQYVDDVRMPGMIHGITVRSSIARGKIRGIRFGDGVSWDEFTIVTAADIPGKNAVTLILDDQPFLADGVVNHPEEPIVLLAHSDEGLLEKARGLVQIDYEPLPALFTLEDSERGDLVIWGEDNVFKKFVIEKGDLDGVWARADYVVEGEYRTGAQEQLYIEPNGMIAAANPSDGVTVWGSMQCPYYIHKALLSLFPLPPEKIRIIQMETGGGFGGKEEYPSILAGHAALLAWKSGRPVKMVYDRAEDMVATTKRHPSRSRLKAAVTNDGEILGIDFRFDIDGGAYATLSAVVLSRGTIHACGPYHFPNVRVTSRAFATNCPPHGAFRGFGAPQSIFAMERLMDKIAGVVGVSPDEIRRRNFLKPGQTTSTGQTVRENVDLNGILDRALAASDYSRKRAEFALRNTGRVVKKGIGFASFMHGAGFTGSGERYLQSVVGMEATREGRVRILSSSAEIGQGTNTIFSQVAADALGISY